VNAPPKGWDQVVKAWRSGELPSPVPETVPAPPEPTLVDLATNFATATARWAAEGFPVVDQAVYAARAAACDACEYWDGAARLGLGKCKHAKCGCTRFKRWLATERCPIARWPFLTSRPRKTARKAFLLRPCGHVAARPLLTSCKSPAATPPTLPPPPLPTCARIKPLSKSLNPSGAIHLFP